MNDSSRAVLEAMHAGQPVSKKEIETVIKALEEMLPEARERGQEWYERKIMDSIERARQYKKVRGIKARPFGDIQSDIDRAQQMINDYRMRRKYELAAKWERIRDEYSTEYREALTGRAYVTKIEEADANAAKAWIPQGYQICL